MSYRIVDGRVYQTGLISDINKTQRSKIQKKPVNSFEDILRESINSSTGHKFKISNHATERLKGIKLNSLDYKKLEDGFQKAREKGSKNTVMLYKDMAFVASVENNTLITVVEEARARENIFTNIDSLVIL